MTLPEKLRSLREANNMSQAQVAEKIGITSRSYVAYELGERYPSRHEIYEKLAECFGVDVSYLDGDDENFVTTASNQYGETGMQQAMAIISEVRGLYAGGALSDADKDAVMIALQQAYFDSKEKKYSRRMVKKDK